MSAPVWFITAASSGFGRQMALEALGRGHTVVASARSPDRLADLAAAGAHTLALDVTWPQDRLESVARAVFDRHGRVDFLVNAAGYIHEGALEELDPAELHATFHTNVFGAFNTIRAFLPHMRAQDLPPPLPTSVAGRPRATVVTFGSLGSWIGGATYSSYAMTKWSASALAESLAEELAPFSIRATVIEPGYFRTAFLSPGAMKTPAGGRIPAYDDEATPSGRERRALAVTGGRQPGDPVRGARAAVDVLTGSGPAGGRDLPVRIVLGTDAERTIRDKCRSTIALLDEWQDVIRSTDFPEGE